MLLRSTSYFSLYRLKGFKWDNCFVRIDGMVLRQLAVVDERPLGQIILPKSLL